MVLILCFLIAQPALAFVSEEMKRGSKIEAYDLERENRCSPSPDKENPCEEPMILGGEGGDKLPETKDERDRLDFDLEWEIKALVQENDGFFDVALILEVLRERYPFLTEDEILSAYGGEGGWFFNSRLLKVAVGRSEVIGGEGGN